MKPVDSPAILVADPTARFAFAALIAGALCIALSPIFVRVSEAGPIATAFWRVALAVPVLWLWLASDTRPSRARRPSTPRDFLRLSLAGAFFAGDLAFWHLSIQYTSIANSTLLANMAPIFVTLGAVALFGERVTRTFLAGLACALIGAVVLMGDSLAIGADTLLGDGLGVVTAMFYAAYLLAVGRLRADFSTATIMTWSALTTAILLLPLGLLAGETLWPATLFGWGVLVALAWISHAGGQSLITFALAHLPASFSSVSLLVQPVAAAILAWLLLAEALGPIQALGGAVVLVGIALARRGSRRPARSQGEAG